MLQSDNAGFPHKDAKKKNTTGLAMIPITRHTLAKLLELALKLPDSILKPKARKTFFGGNIPLIPATLEHEGMAERFSGINPQDQVAPSDIANLDKSKLDILRVIDDFFNQGQTTLSLAGVKKLSQLIKRKGIEAPFKATLESHVKRIPASQALMMSELAADFKTHPSMSSSLAASASSTSSTGSPGDSKLGFLPQSTTSTFNLDKSFYLAKDGSFESSERPAAGFFSSRTGTPPPAINLGIEDLDTLEAKSQSLS